MLHALWLPEITIRQGQGRDNQSRLRWVSEIVPDWVVVEERIVYVDKKYDGVGSH
jgi:hypothetical protein